PFCRTPYERNEDKMNNRRISMMIALLVVASMALNACGGAPATAPAATSAPVKPTSAPVQPTSAPAEPVTLTIWHNWGPDDAKGAPLQSIFKDFMTANSDIVIKDEVYVDADIP